MKSIKETRSRFEQMRSVENGRKYSYCFFDYLYYRLYVTYKKHKDPARLSACCVFAATFDVILLFLSIFVNNVLTDSYFSRKNFTELQGGLMVLCLDTLFCVIPFYMRYTRKRTDAILLKYKGNKWNRIIPSWVIYTLPGWSLFAGIGIGMLIFK